MKTSFFFFLFLSLFFLLLDNLGTLRPIRAGAERLFIPVKGKIFQAKFLSQSLTEKQNDVADERERRLSVLEGQLSVCQAENRDIKRLLGTPLPPEWRFLPARIIGVGKEPMINKGRQEGVVQGMAVIFDNILVGKISKVNEHTSLVIFPQSSSSKLLVVTRGGDGKAGIKARGLLLPDGKKLSLEQVLTDEVLDEGDLVFTAGDKELPPDLLIGKINSVQKSAGEVFQKAQVESLVNPDKLETVFIVVF